MRRSILLSMLLAMPPSLRAGNQTRPGYLVVSPRAAVRTLEPLLELRRRDYAVSAMTTEALAPKGSTLTPALVKRAIRAHHGKHPLACLLLVGDTRAGGKDIPAMPTHPLGFDVWYGYLATDNPRDARREVHRPAIAVGRLPARTSADLETMVSKTVSYETRSRPGPWQRRVHVVAGTPGYSPELDALINGFATMILANCVPPAYHVTMTHGLTSSPYCPPPDEFEERVIELFDGGALYVAYVGHGSARSAMDVAGFRTGTIMNCGTMRKVRCPAQSRPISFFIACNMSEFDGGSDCLAEVALKAPGGPVACVGSVRRSHPYGNAVLGVELVRALLDRQEATLGRCLLKAQTSLAAPTMWFDLVRQGIDKSAGLPPQACERERIKHVYLYNLLGDPALRVSRPAGQIGPIQAGLADNGSHWQVAAGVPGINAGSAIVTLEIPRAFIRGKLAQVPPANPKWRDAMRRNYKTANRKVVAEVRARVDNGSVHARIPTRVDGAPLATGKYFIKVFAWNDRTAAAGATMVSLAAAPR